jgi:hypothetical protein
VAPFVIATCDTIEDLRWFLNVGYGGSGTYNLSNGALLVSGFAATETIGAGRGFGLFNQTGGIHTISNQLVVGDSAKGIVNLSDGTLTTTDEIIGHFDGDGTFNQTGGTHTVSEILYIAQGIFGGGVSCLGVYNLSGGAATISGTSGMYVGFNIGGSGTVTLSDGALSLTTGNEYVGYRGAGSFTQSGGTHTIGGTLVISANPGSSSGSYNQSGGTLIVAGGISNNDHFTFSGGTLAASVTNSAGGVFTLTGAGTRTLSSAFVNFGTVIASSTIASFTNISGNGTLSVGTATSTAFVTAAFVSQRALNIAGGASLTLQPAANRLTHSASSLQIASGGTFDLSNHELLTFTVPGTIKGYLAAAYDPAGNADWSKPGLTSGVAKGNPSKYGVAYAYGGDQSAHDAGITTHGGAALGANQTLVRAVLTGDANMDGAVNFFDLTQILGYKYNTGQPASYTDGDLNYDGVVNFFDIATLLSANYNTGETFGPGPLSEAAASRVPEPACLGLVATACAALLSRRHPSRRKDNG